MKVYIIEAKENLEDAKEQIEKFTEVIYLPDKAPIESFSPIFSDPEEKIIAVAPRRIDWSFPKDALEKIPNLKAICSKSQWIEYIDLEYCKKNNIVVTNTPAANAQSVAEYAIWMMFSLARKLPGQIRENFATELDVNHEHTELEGKTAGIIGLGNIGSRIAKMVNGLGMNVIYWSRNKKDVPFSHKELDTVLSTSDVIFNCLEVSQGTQGLINENNLRRVKKSAYFISVIGGMGWGVTDDELILKMVEEGKLAGFSIESDHKDKSKYTNREFNGNIFIPASNAWYTSEAVKRTREMWVEAILNAVKMNK